MSLLRHRKRFSLLGRAKFDDGPTYGPELILNPGFETAGAGGIDVFANWSENFGDGAVADDAVENNGGAHSLKLTSGPNRNTSAYQAFVAVPGQEYRLVYWTRGNGTTAGRLGIFNATGSTWIVDRLTTGVTAAVWTQVVQTFTAPVGCISIRIYPYCVDLNGAVVNFDDFSVRAVNP